MKGPHTAVSYSSKGQAGDDLADDRIIHDDASGAHVSDDALLKATVFRE